MLNLERFKQLSGYVCRENWRVWSERDKCLYYFHLPSLDRDLISSVFLQKLEWMQSLGVTYASGQEVYSADRVKLSVGTGYIRWNPETLQYVVVWKSKKVEPLAPILHLCEFVGHYFDNPVHLRQRR